MLKVRLGAAGVDARLTRVISRLRVQQQEGGVISFPLFTSCLSLSLQADPRRPVPQRPGRPHHHERRALPLHHVVRPRPEGHGHGPGHALLLPGGRGLVPGGAPGRAGAQQHGGGLQGVGAGVAADVGQLHPRPHPAGYVCRYEQRGEPPRARSAEGGGKGSIAHHSDILSALSREINSIC